MTISKEQFLALRAKGLSTEQIAGFEKRRQAELAQAQPEQKKTGGVQGFLEDYGNRGIGQVEALGKAYNSVKQLLAQGIQRFGPIPALMTAANQNFKSLGVPDLLRQVMAPSAPQLQPLQQYNTRDLAEKGSGIAADELLTAGLLHGVPAGVKQVDKGLTSVLRRAGGMSSSDIKLGRELMNEGGVGAVLSKAKAKPEYLGREIAPKAAELAKSRVSSMNPNAMHEIGIPSEDVQLAQDLKAKFGLNEFPTESSASDYYSNMLKNTPQGAQIKTDNLSEALNSLESQLDPKVAEYVKSYVNKKGFNEVGGLDKVPLSKADYQDIRGFLNNTDPKGENPVIQALKGSLDKDFEAVNPMIAEAKGRFQLSRQVPKAEAYLDTAKSAESMASRLRSSEAPESVQVRESLNRLLGPEGESLIKDAQAQRLAKQWYGSESGKALNPRANIKMEGVKELARPIPRAYEKARAGILNFFRGTKPAVQATETPYITSSKAPYQPSTPIPEEALNIKQLIENVKNYKNESGYRVSPESELATAEEQARRAVSQGYIGEGGGGSGAWPEVMPQPENVPYGLPYKETKLSDYVKKKRKK